MCRVVSATAALIACVIVSNARADLADGLRAFDAGDYETAYEELRPAAQYHGYPSAMNNLGTMFEKGLGVERNGEQAAYWYERSAMQGFRSAMYNLGILFAEGDVVAKDVVRGAAWLAAAYDHGEEDARAVLKLLLSTMTPEQVATAKALRREIDDRIYKGIREAAPKTPLASPPVDRDRLMSGAGIVDFYSGNQISFQLREATALQTFHPHGTVQESLAGARARVDGEYREGYYRARWWVDHDILCVDIAKLDDFDDCYWVERLSGDAVRAYSRKTGAATEHHLVRGGAVPPPTADDDPFGLADRDVTELR